MGAEELKLKPSRFYLHCAALLLLYALAALIWWPILDPDTGSIDYGATVTHDDYACETRILMALVWAVRVLLFLLMPLSVRFLRAKKTGSAYLAAVAPFGLVVLFLTFMEFRAGLSLCKAFGVTPEASDMIITHVKDFSDDKPGMSLPPP
jgi:hypothetical protein